MGKTAKAEKKYKARLKELEPDLETDDSENDDSENDELETDDSENDDSEKDELETDDSENDDSENDDSKNDDSEKDDSEKDELEAWQETEDEKETDEKEFPDVSARTHIKKTKKLRGKIDAKDSEIETLKAEIEKIKSQSSEQNNSLNSDLNLNSKRPDEDDYDDRDEYLEALDKHDDARAKARKLKERQETQITELKTQIKEDVNSHYDRAEKLIKENGISPEVYQKADKNIREAIETVMPKKGNATFDYLLSVLGIGSEKVSYFVGNPKNQAALNKLQTLLISDPSGMKAAVYLGELKHKLTAQVKRRSKAPAPAAHATGDSSVTKMNESAPALKRKYDKHHKTGDVSAAFKIKRAAKRKGVDVSAWATT